MLTISCIPDGFPWQTGFRLSPGLKMIERNDRVSVFISRPRVSLSLFSKLAFPSLASCFCLLCPCGYAVFVWISSVSVKCLSSVVPRHSDNAHVCVNCGLFEELLRKGVHNGTLLPSRMLHWIPSYCSHHKLKLLCKKCFSLCGCALWLWQFWSSGKSLYFSWFSFSVVTLFVVCGVK